MTVKDLKDRCLEGDVFMYAWLPTKEMMADCLTKEMKMPSSMEAVLLGKGLELKEPFLNEVRNVEGELRMSNIRNRKQVKIDDDNDSGQLRGGQEVTGSAQRMTGGVEDSGYGRQEAMVTGCG